MGGWILLIPDQLDLRGRSDRVGMSFKVSPLSKKDWFSII